MNSYVTGAVIRRLREIARRLSSQRGPAGQRAE